MAESADTASRTVGFPEAEPRGLRVALSPYLFRGMLLGMGTVAVGLRAVTRSATLTWDFAKARARTLAWLLGVQVHVRGAERLAGAGPFVFTSNHQSHLDILVLLGFLPGPTRFAAKRELWRHPVMGAVLDTLDMIPIDRENSARSIAALDRASKRGESVVIFPEGRRSRDGQLLPFKLGAFVLAIQTGIPVVPVACVGTRRLMPRGSQLTVVPGEVEIIIGEPIPTTGLTYDDREALSARVRSAVEEHHTGW